MITRISLILLFSSQLHASSRVDFNELRLREMAKVMNGRDYQLMLIELSQLEMLDLACTKELKAHRVPISCFEMQHKIKKRGLKIEGEATAEDCHAKLNDLSWQELQNLKTKQHFLPVRCQSDLTEKVKILSYKRAGKNLE